MCQLDCPGKSSSTRLLAVGSWEGRVTVEGLAYSINSCTLFGLLRSMSNLLSVYSNFRAKCDPCARRKANWTAHLSPGGRADPDRGPLKPR